MKNVVFVLLLFIALFYGCDYCERHSDCPEFGYCVKVSSGSNYCEYDRAENIVCRDDASCISGHCVRYANSADKICAYSQCIPGDDECSNLGGTCLLGTNHSGGIAQFCFVNLFHGMGTFEQQEVTNPCNEERCEDISFPTNSWMIALSGQADPNENLDQAFETIVTLTKANGELLGEIVMNDTYAFLNYGNAGFVRVLRTQAQWALNFWQEADGTTCISTEENIGECIVIEPQNIGEILIAESAFGTQTNIEDENSIQTNLFTLGAAE